MKKAAVIGLGDIAPIHIGAIAANDEIELCAVCDINPAAKERAPQGIPFYTDYKEMIQKEKPDCVHICLRILYTNVHQDQASKMDSRLPHQGMPLLGSACSYVCLSGRKSSER